MKRKRFFFRPSYSFCVSYSFAFLFMGCGIGNLTSKVENPAENSPQVSCANVHQESHLGAFDAPAAVLWHPPTKSWYVTNLGGGLSYERDGYGWITRLDANGHIVKAKWLADLHAPTGMTFMGHKLYVVDRDEVLVVDTATAQVLKKISLPGAQFPIDMTHDLKKNLYITDLLGNKIYRIFNEERVDVLVAGPFLQNPKGIGFDAGFLWIGTIDSLLKLDLKTLRWSSMIQRFYSGHYAGLMKIGKKIVATDSKAGKVVVREPTGKVSQILNGPSKLGDFGYNPETKMLALPEMDTNRIYFLRYHP